MKIVLPQDFQEGKKVSIFKIVITCSFQSNHDLSPQHGLCLLFPLHPLSPSLVKRVIISCFLLRASLVPGSG